MGLQLIFVVETNEKCKSDWIYIKDTIDRFYTYDQAHVKLSTVYMDGKGKYADKDKKVQSLIKQYNSAAKGNDSKVIYCFDCDDYDRKPEDAEFQKTTEQYCKDHGYAYLWFCKDVESVYLGKRVPDRKKKEEAAGFKAKQMIFKVDETRLRATSLRVNASNILRVLDAFAPKLQRR